MFNHKNFILLTAVLLMLFNLISLNESRVQAEPQMEIYYVVPGDTLWNIAAKRIDNRTDIRDKIDEIIKDNNADPNLTVGQPLKLRKID